MLAANQPSEAMVNWAEEVDLVKHAQDRPWYYAEPPIFITNTYEQSCLCRQVVSLQKYVCEDNAGFVYVGQCTKCQAIIWSFWDEEE